jgi:NifU-like protein involved in Fe-S cluster formation
MSVENIIASAEKKRLTRPNKGEGPMLDHLSQVIIGACVLFGLMLIWFVVYYYLNPMMENPDGAACITGQCGDTMEIGLKFKGDRVVNTSQWSSGCTHSAGCVRAAAALAKDKTPDEIIEIDAGRIRTSVGGLPEEYLHCAKLAEETLHAALDQYMKKRRS